ncbi:MAG: SIMPL domain-containing protein [Tepidisphaerales bacterium]
MSYQRCFALALLAVLAAPASRAGSPADDRVIHSTGAAGVKRPADTMRVTVELTAEGKTMKDALETLKTRRAAAEKKLAALGPVDKSVEFSDARAGSQDPRQRQMERMLRSRMQTKTAKKPAETPPVKVALTVKAEWSLAGKTGDALLMAATELQEKIRAADLGEAKSASLEEQEAMEESGNSSYDGSTPVRPGEPAFVFVARVPEEVRTKALADALGKARAGAERLAKAAGGQLGAIRALSTQSTPDADEMDAYAYQRRAYMMRYGGGSDDSDEAVSASPGPVGLNLMVQVSYEFKQ